MDSYDYNTLECRLKAAQAQLRAFRSGAKYQELQALRAHDAAHYNRVIQGLKADVAEAHLETIRVMDLWFEIFEDKCPKLQPLFSLFVEIFYSKCYTVSTRRCPSL